MGKKRVHRIHLKVACMRQFTCLWSSPQFCTRNREGVRKRDKEEKGIQHKRESECKESVQGAERAFIQERPTLTDMPTNIPDFFRHWREGQEVEQLRQWFDIELPNHYATCYHMKLQLLAHIDSCNNVSQNILFSPQRLILIQQWSSHDKVRVYHRWLVQNSSWPLDKVSSLEICHMMEGECFLI